MTSRLLLVTTLLVAPSLAAQNGPPDSLVNTKFYPRDTPVQTVIDQMRAITRALGVRCTYCHVGDEGINIWEYDFVSDEKHTKQKARVMLEMVQAINAEYLPKLADLDAQGLEVTCNTCHRGVALPIPLEDLLVRTWVDSGYAAMEARYEHLRERYHGSDAYDFGEGTLAAVGGFLLARGAHADALLIDLKNLALFPTSGRAHFLTGEAQIAVGDTAAAIGSWRRAVELDPRNRVARQRLQALAPDR
jgi:tetratricopeptide (TPR) repeat protein